MVSKNNSTNSNEKIMLRDKNGRYAGSLGKPKKPTPTPVPPVGVVQKPLASKMNKNVDSEQLTSGLPAKVHPKTWRVKPTVKDPEKVHEFYRTIEQYGIMEIVTNSEWVKNIDTGSPELQKALAEMHESSENFTQILLSLTANPAMTKNPHGLRTFVEKIITRSKKIRYH